MLSRRKPQSGKGAVETAEEAFHLVRMAPIGALAAYFIGTFPFVLGLVYFWADMGASAFAHQHAAREALTVAGLFVWMKAWHVVYVRRLWDIVTGYRSTPWRVGRVICMAVRQAAVQSTGLFALPLALLAALPFGWVYAFYQNASILDDGGRSSVRALSRKSARLAGVWPKQNHLLIWMLSPFLMMFTVGVYLVAIPLTAAMTPDWSSLFLGFYSVVLMLLLMVLSPFGIVIAANIAIMILLTPQLVNMLLGIQTVFVQSPQSMMNSSFFAVVCGLTYCCMDPLMKAAYVLRCFQGESIGSGEDLRVEIRRYTRGGQGIVAIALCFPALLASSMCGAEEAGTTPPPAGVVVSGETSASGGSRPSAQPAAALSVSAAELSAALDRELQGRLYAWRLPRVNAKAEEPGIVAGFLRAVAETLGDWIRKFMELLRRIGNWLDKHMPRFGGSTNLFEVSVVLKIILYVLLAALLSVAAVVVYRAWRRRSRVLIPVQATAIQAAPDIEDEGTRPDELPQERWLMLARDLAGRGELRLALRAVFLAMLAYLGEQGWVRIARFKSNRDYRLELLRRAHVDAALLDAFDDSAGIYEMTWYGKHEATEDLVARVIADHERLRGTI